MEPFTLGIGAVGTLLNYLNKEDAMNSAAQNLAFQRQQAAQQQRLSTATRTDSFGNTESYDPATNTWSTTLSPMQKAIQDAQQGEQFQSLTTDAARNRSARKTAYDESNAALPGLNKAIAGFQYDQPGSEGADRDKLVSLMVQANQDKNLGDRSTLARQALRLDRGGTIPSLFKASQDQAGSDLADSVLKGYVGAKQQRQSEVAGHNSQYLPQIQGLEQIVQNNGSGAPIADPKTASMLSAIQGQMASGGLSALASGASGVNTGSNTLATIQAKPIDLSFLKGLNSNSKSTKTTADASGNTDGSSAWDANIPWASTPDYMNDINFNF